MINWFFRFTIAFLMCVLICVAFQTKVTAVGVDHLLISEVYYDTIGTDSEEEWVEIYNPTNTGIDLSEYKLGDEETSGGSEGMFGFPENSGIESRRSKVVAKNAIGFYKLYGKYPDFEIDNTDDGLSDFSNTPDMSKYSSWSSGSFSLTNSGDEVLLLDSEDVVVDAVVFEGGSFGGVVAHSGVGLGLSISRDPINIDTNDCSADFESRYAPNPGYDRVFEAEDGFTEIGTMSADGKAEEGLVMSAETDLTTAGYLYYGPYADDLTEGMYQASFRLKISSNVGSNLVAILDAHNSGGDGVYESRKIYADDFAGDNEWQNFSLWFERTDQGSMEWRVWFADEADLAFDNVMISEVDRVIYEVEDLSHNAGSVIIDESFSNGSGWQAQTTDATNHMIFGPYAGLSEGSWKARIVARVDDSTNEETAFIFNINNTFGTGEAKNKIVKGVDFENNDVWQDFGINFVKNNGGVMEYRVFYPANVNVVVDNIILEQTKSVRYEAEDLYGSLGGKIYDNTASGKKFRKATVSADDEGWLVYGPYTRDQGVGEYEATFRLKVSDNSSSESVAWIDVYNFGGSGIEEAIPVYGTDFAESDSWQEFSVDFSRVNEGLMEYRVYFLDVVDVGVDFVEINNY